MLRNSRRLTAMALALAALFSFSHSGPLAGSEPLQSAPEITGEECAFYLDYNGDGEGDQSIASKYIPQNTPVVGSCRFKLRMPEAGTLIVESELRDWEGEVEVTKEPEPDEVFKTHPGRPEIPDLDGSMSITVRVVAGDTPRSERERTLTDGYLHQVQIPNAFRLLGVTATFPDGSKDRLEENAQSASNEYISIHRALSEKEGELQEWAVTLAGEWLEEGYPQVANSIVKKGEEAQTESASWWKWAAIGTWSAVAIIAGLAIFVWLKFIRGPVVVGPDPNL